MIITSLLAAGASLGLSGVTLFFWFRPSRRNRKKTAVRFGMIVQAAGKTTTITENTMQKLSLFLGILIVQFFGLSAHATKAAIDGVITAVSSDTNVLTVTPLPDGTFSIEPKSVGTATITVSGDADLGDGIKTITTVYEYLVYNDAEQADHFGYTIIQPQKLPAPASATGADTLAGGTATSADAGQSSQSADPAATGADTVTGAASA